MEIIPYNENQISLIKTKIEKLRFCMFFRESTVGVSW